MQNHGLGTKFGRYPKTPQNLFGRSDQSAKLFGRFEKSSHWVSVVRDLFCIDIVASRQKIGVILENKVLQKMCLTKNGLHTMSTSQNTIISFEYNDFWSKICLILYPFLGNSTTQGKYGKIPVFTRTVLLSESTVRTKVILSKSRGEL